MRNKLEEIIDEYPDESFLRIEGHDNAIIGVDESSMRLCYSMKQIISNLMEEMPEDEAIEYYEFNISGAYLGEKTPVLINLF